MTVGMWDAAARMFEPRGGIRGLGHGPRRRGWHQPSALTTSRPAVKPADRSGAQHPEHAYKTGAVQPGPRRTLRFTRRNGYPMAAENTDRLSS